MKYGVKYAGPRRRRVRRDWWGTLLTLLTLLALAALCGWLWSCVRDAAGPVSGFRLQVSGLPLAMAPMPDASKPDALKAPAALLVLAALIWLTVVAERKLDRRRARERERRLADIDQEMDERWRRVRQKQREISARRKSITVGPLESLSEAETEIVPGPQCVESTDDPLSSIPGGGEVPREDLRRIVAACRVESRAVLLLIEAAQTTLCVDDYGDALAGARRRQEQLVRTLKALVCSLAAEDGPAREGAA